MERASLMIIESSARIRCCAVGQTELIANKKASSGIEKMHRAFKSFQCLRQSTIVFRTIPFGPCLLFEA